MQSILIVDDRNENLTALESLLERPDVQLLKSDNGNDALRLLLRYDVALVLLDVNMPALNGDLVCRMLKESPQTKDVLVALYSSMPEDELQQLAAKSGADGYIVKSNDVSLLSQQLDRLLRRPSFTTA
jgi:CheY-like chemotaxis protein